MSSGKVGFVKNIRQIFHTGDIYLALKPVFVICHLFFVYPLNNKNQLSVINLCLALVFLSSLTTFYLYCRSFDMCFGESCHYKKIVTGCSLCSLITVYLLILSEAYMNSSTETYSGVLLGLKKVDQHFAKHGSRVQYSTKYILVIIFRLLMLILYGYCYTKTAKISFKQSTANLYLYRCTQIIIMCLGFLSSRPFAIVFSFLEVHFNHLNQRLVTIGESKYFPGKLEIMEDLARLHHSLSNVCVSCERTFCRQTIILMPSILFNIAASLYINTAFFKRIDYLKGSFYFKEILLSSIWTISWFSVLLGIVKPCHNVQQKAKEFSALLYNILIEDKTKELITSDKLQLHLLMKREVKFTACGFFPLDNTLIHSMIAAATTYVVILVQFGPKT